jgi:tRNA-binding protein
LANLLNQPLSHIGITKRPLFFQKKSGIFFLTSRALAFQIGTMKSFRITYEDFARVDIRVDTIVRAEPYPEAKKPAFKIWINLGPEIGEKKTSAQITKHYTLEILIGMQVACVVNFPTRQIGKFTSEILLLGFPDEEDEVVMVCPRQKVPNGGKLY